MVIVGGDQRPWRVGLHRRNVVQLLGLLGFLLPSTSFALSDESSCAGIEREHSAWGSLLGKYVHDGLVDYEGWKRQGMAELNNYLANLSSLCAAGERAAGREHTVHRVAAARCFQDQVHSHAWPGERELVARRD